MSSHSRVTGSKQPIHLIVICDENNVIKTWSPSIVDRSSSPLPRMTWKDPRANSVLCKLRHFVSSQILISVFFCSTKLEIVWKKVTAFFKQCCYLFKLKLISRKLVIFLYIDNNNCLGHDNYILIMKCICKMCYDEMK